MSLTKTDLKQIANVLDSRLKPIEKRLNETATKSELKSIEKGVNENGVEMKSIKERLDKTATTDDLEKAMVGQNKHMRKMVVDFGAEIRKAYPSREEFDQLKAEVEDIRDELDALKDRCAAA